VKDYTLNYFLVLLCTVLLMIIAEKSQREGDNDE
jgi:hypothetical protein